MVDDLKPILFAENSTTFTSNGIGRLADALDCVVTEERNGAYELEMTYPMSGQHYEDIAIRKIVVVKPSANATLQAFRIYKLGKPINGKVKVYAQHISYDLSKNVCMPQTVVASGTACNTALQGLKSTAIESCPFSFWTDVTTVASYKQTVPASIRSRLGGTEGSILDQFGGEYEWDNFTVKLHRHRGTERDITLRYGKNITDIEQEENIAETVTGVVPYWIDYEGTHTVMLPERVIYSSHASEYSSKLTVPLDLSQEWQNPPTEAGLRAAAQVYMNKSGMGIPKVSVKVSFINLADTEEYKDILPLENVNLCDTIKVQFEKLGINTTAEIVETEYDVLAEKYKSVQVGSLRSTLASTISDMEKGMATEIDDTGKRVFAETNTKAQDLVNSATAWLTSGNGYVVAVKNPDGSWKELLFMDDNDVTTAHNVLRINENGLGFSSNGVGGPYTQAWTLDGRLVIGGTNVPSITCYDADGNIIFQASRNGLIWDSANTTLDANGRLTTNDAVISGMLISQREVEDAQGQVHIYKVVVDSGSVSWYYGNTLLGEIGNSNIGFNISSTDELHLHSNDTTTIYSEEDLIIGANDTLEINNSDYSGVIARMSMDASGEVSISGDNTLSLTRNSTNSRGVFNGSEFVMNSSSIFLNPGNIGRGDLEIFHDGNTYTGTDGWAVESVSLDLDSNSDTLTGICCNLNLNIWDESGTLHWQYSWDIIDISYLTSVSGDLSINRNRIRHGIVTSN